MLRKRKQYISIQILYSDIFSSFVKSFRKKQDAQILCLIILCNRPYSSLFSFKITSRKNQRDFTLAIILSFYYYRNCIILVSLFLSVHSFSRSHTYISCYWQQIKLARESTMIRRNMLICDFFRITERTRDFSRDYIIRNA